MSGVRLYSIYLNNIVKDVSGYTLTKNLSSSDVTLSDVSSVAKDLDEVLYLSNTLTSKGNKGLLNSYNFLNKKLPLDSEGIMLMDIGVDVVSKDVLRYCGSLLDTDKPINTKKIGKLFKDISDGLASSSDLSKQLINNVYEDDDIDDNFYELDDYDSLSTTKDVTSELDSSPMGSIDTDEYYDEKDDSLINIEEITKKENNGYNTFNEADNLVEDDSVDLSNGNINDKLAYAITKASGKISKTPKKVREGSKIVCSNILDFDN